MNFTFARVLLGLIGACKRLELAAGPRRVFAIATREQAQTAVRQLTSEWRGGHARVAVTLEEECEPCLAYPVFPPAHQPRPHTIAGRNA